MDFKEFFPGMHVQDIGGKFKGRKGFVTIVDPDKNVLVEFGGQTKSYAEDEFGLLVQIPGGTDEQR